MAGSGAAGVGPLGIAGAAAVVVAVGAGVFFLRPETGGPEIAIQPQEAAQPTAPSAPAAQKPEEAVAAAVAPRFDVVRVDADGQTLVAGTAEPGARVEVLLDGDVIGEANADASGQFAAILDVPPATAPRVMSLMSFMDAGSVASDQTVIVDATPQVAEAPEAAPQVAEAPEAVPDAVAEAEVSEEQSEAPAVETSELQVQETEPTESVAEVEADVGTASEQEEVVEEVAVAAETAQAFEEAVPGEEASVEVAGEVNEETIETANVNEEDPAQPRVLLADEEGIRVLQSPEAMTSVALDTISYTDQGDVSLGGRALGEGFVRVYLDDKPVTTSRIEADGSWRTALPQVDTGVYTLRVDELDDAGEVTSRVETPFLREDPEVLAEAVGDAPEGSLVNAPSMTVQPGATLWAIAREKYGEGRLYVKVFEANRGSIKDPDMIFPGQVFDLPD